MSVARRLKDKGWVAVLQTLKRNGWTARVRTWFPDREFFMRSQGQVRFIKISARLQMAAAAILAAIVLAWLVAMVAMIALQFSATNQRVAMLEREAKVTNAETRVSSYRKDIDHVAADLQRRQAFIEQVVKSELGALPPQDPSAAHDTVSDSSAQTAKTVTKISAMLPGAVGLARIEQRQLAFAEQLTRLADTRSAAAEAAIRRVGLNPGLMLARMNDRSAQGGPLLGAASGLDPRFQRLGLSLARMGALEDGLAAVPHNLPASLEYISSGFGYRSDPFTGVAAFHAGLDFRGPVGAPIYAAAKGTVSFAGVRQGYGNCIEITHGNGVLTRYAHMSAFRAHVGEAVAAGDTIGAIGSTGRSTGPHLHFEVRINDQPVNPRPFLDAPTRFGANAHVLPETKGRAAVVRG
jgi:murein DD-endopeptidase MepM/ murein hydrolase activator NlpD